MSRREEHLEAMLRHLGSVYYQTLHGLASASDVTNAVESVRAHEAASVHEATRTDGYRCAHEAGLPHDAGPPEGVSRARQPAAIRSAPRPRRPAEETATRRPLRGRRRVTDVMSTDVVTVSKTMPYKQVAQLLAAYDLTSVPVVSGGGRILGMVSEADLLLRQERAFGRAMAGLPRRSRRQRGQAEALTAVELMSSPAITIHPDAPLGAAARLMNGHHIRRLPVVDSAGQLLGVVSRQQLLSVFLRPDTEIAEEIRVVLSSIMLDDARGVTVAVAGGVATLAGTLSSDDLIDGAVRLAAEVDGVVTVRSRLDVRPALQPTS